MSEPNTELEQNQDKESRGRPRGQSIVIIAAAMVVLLGFIGLAVDLGVVWLRDAQLTAAVDSAALAGAPELSLGGLPPADEKATQFLYTNRIPGEAVDTLESAAATTELGARQYTITITWNVELYFMRVLGFQEVAVVKSATAAYFPLVDVYASRRVDAGALSTSNQSVFGPNICTSYGDPFSPLNSPYEPGLYSYRYRIYIPPDYEAEAGTDIVRVEIFDPDSINRSASQATIVHTQRWLAENPTAPQTEQLSCGGGRNNACIIDTCEWSGSNCGGSYTSFDDETLINPFWYLRVDENRGAGSPPGNGNCGQPGSYNPGFNTQTVYDLYYFQQNPDGTLIETPLASYTGQTGDGRDNGEVHNTDLSWVSPGAFNPSGEVPTDCGSATGGYALDGRCAESGPSATAPGDGQGFEIDLSEDTPRIVTDAASGARYLYLDVTTVSGSSENGFELWAGPPNSQAIPADANARNVWVADNPNARTSHGVVVYAMGILPMNSNADELVDIPLIYVPPEYSGRDVAVSLFDADSGTNPPLTFYFDTISRDDYEVVYGVGNDPEGRCFDNTVNCNDTWVGPPGTDSPPFIVRIPELSNQCTDPATQDPAICTPFYGGNMYINYQAGGQDTYVWQITLPSLPYLVR